ncbi:Type 1 glutamine amidotransferase-like domain-containing protein [Candidatus Woesebacteria bacterium]|nr:MAG: Type 1 glutamine amidotransferase-like domain-containing protein [Candidatus Woesebacteria bacterium]
MKLYLSSFKIGDEGQRLAHMVGGNKRIAIISNALDCYSDLERRKKGEDLEIAELKLLGLKPEILDLRKYFGKRDELELFLRNFDAVWVRGGNCFVLRVAMKKSGFDDIINKYEGSDFVYAGYSAGACVLSPSLKGIDFVDNPLALQDAYPKEKVCWEGLGIIDFAFEPHYKSDHPESADIDKEIEHLIDNKILFKAFRDGEVYIKDYDK